MGAKLQYADFREAEASFVHLDKAELQEALLTRGRFHGSTFSGAKLHGAILHFAQFHGALLDSAELQGAHLQATRLYAATLTGAKLHAAWLDNAVLSAAKLDGANLYGAFLYRTELQGVSIANVDLTAARIVGTWLWRIKGIHGQLDGTTIIREPRLTNLTVDKFTAMQEEVKRQVTDAHLQQTVLSRLSELDPTKKEPETWQQTQALLAISIDDTPNGPMGIKLITIACRSEAAPYVARGLIRNGQFRALGADMAMVVEALSAPTCAGANGLRGAEWARVRATNASPPPKALGSVPATNEPAQQ